MQQISVLVSSLAMPVCVLALAVAFLPLARCMSFGALRPAMARGAQWGLSAFLCGGILVTVVLATSRGGTSATPSMYLVMLAAGACVALLVPARTAARSASGRIERVPVVVVGVGAAVAWVVLALVAMNVRGIERYGSRTPDGQFRLNSSDISAATTTSSMPGLGDCLVVAILIGLVALAAGYFVVHTAGEYASARLYYAALLGASTVATMLGSLASGAAAVASDARASAPLVTQLNDYATSLNGFEVLLTVGGVGLLLALVTGLSRKVDRDAPVDDRTSGNAR